MTSGRPANAHLIGQGGPMLERALVTPALCVDIEVLKANLVVVAAAGKAGGKALRPHVKAHKCSKVAALQLGAGAIGLSCATISEAEAMAAAGLDGLLLTSPIATLTMAERVASMAGNVGSLLATVDAAEGVTALARMFGADRPLGVLIDLNVGQNRTGVDGRDQALAVAKQIAAAPGLRLSGIQAYYGHLQGIVAAPERAGAVRQHWELIANIRDALRTAGHNIDVITGGGTGSAVIDLGGPFTELQPGSYVFMDKQYGLVNTGLPLGQSLTVAARVISAVRPGRAIIDAGTKAMSTDAGPAQPVASESLTFEHSFMGDEHSLLAGPVGATPGLGALVHLVPPHCDPTVNLYDHLHVMSDGVLTDIWRIDARGHDLRSGKGPGV